jgi:hypothetical protein
MGLETRLRLENLMSLCAPRVNKGAEILLAAAAQGRDLEDVVDRWKWRKNNRSEIFNRSLNELGYFKVLIRWPCHVH